MDDIPAFRLANELISHIFLIARDQTATSRLRPTRAPINFTQVCHRWREIAIGTPQLWTTLHLPSSHNDAIIPALKKWLLWSRPLPLTISICIAERSWRLDRLIFPEALEFEYVDTLCNEADRWYSVCLLLAREEAYSRLATSLVHHSLPILTDLQLDIAHSSDDNSDSDRLLFTQIQSGVPIKSLKLKAWQRTFDFRGFTCPPSLQELRLMCDASFDNLFDVTSLAKSINKHAMLASLHINMPSTIFFDTSELRVGAILPHLKQLKIVVASWEILAALVSWFSAPALELLNLAKPDYHHPDAFREQFLRLLTDARVSLQALYMTFDDMLSYAEIRDAISRLTGLTTLYINDLYLNDDNLALLDALTLNSSGTQDSESSDTSLIHLDKNVVLQHLHVDIHTTIPHQLGFRRSYVEPFFRALVRLIDSRVHFPEGAMSADGHAVRRLQSVTFGDGLNALYDDGPAEKSPICELWSLLEKTGLDS